MIWIDGGEGDPLEDLYGVGKKSTYYKGFRKVIFWGSVPIWLPPYPGNAISKLKKALCVYTIMSVRLWNFKDGGS